MAEQGMSNPSQHEQHSSTTETSPLGTAAITWISAHRWATVVTCIVVVALVATALGGAPLGMVVLLCPLMMVAMMMFGMHGMHHFRGHAAGRPAPGAGDARGDQALDILRERYARGELTQQEYEEQRQVLLTA